MENNFFGGFERAIFYRKNSEILKKFLSKIEKSVVGQVRELWKISIKSVKNLNFEAKFKFLFIFSEKKSQINHFGE